MPHVNSSGGDDLASTDEVKVYKDEGEEEKRSSENLSEDKLGLVTESEEGKTSDIEPGGFSVTDKNASRGPDGKTPDPAPDRFGLLGYPYISPYPFPNGASLPGGLGGKVLSPPPGLGFYMYNDHFSQPPPAHMGISSVHIDPKTGFPRHVYALPPPGQFPHPLYGPDLPQWNGVGAGYAMPSTLRSPYGGSLSSSPLSRFSPPSLLPPHPGLPTSHPGIPHPAALHPGQKPDIHTLHSENNRMGQHCSPHGLMENGSMMSHVPNGVSSPEPQNKIPRVKKPLNAFMLFMKEMRQTVIEECTLKESAAINQILGRRWHALDRSEQSKYYDMARKEKELHMQLYPGWSARDNYATHNKKMAKKRKRENGGGGGGPGMSGHGLVNNNMYGPPTTSLDGDCPNAKKCRARFGLEAQNQWCKPCRRKKKCIRFLEEGCGAGSDSDEDDDPSPATTTEGSSSSEVGSPGGLSEAAHMTVAFSPSSRLPSSSNVSSLSHSTVNLLRPDRGPAPPTTHNMHVIAAT